MNKKYYAVTALLAVGIILLGMAEFPLLYTCFFDAAAIVNEQEPLPEPLETAPHEFMKALQGPLCEETQPLSEDAIRAFLADSREYFDTGVYERLFEMAGSPYDKASWDQLSAINETDNCRIDVERTQGDGTVSAVFSRSLPVLLYYRSSTLPTAQDIKDAVIRLEGYAAQGDPLLLAYLQKIDRIYTGCEIYQNQLAYLYLSVSEDASTQEVTQTPTLQSCCSCGTWQVYSDDTETALACLIGRCCLILYYDAARQDFCGYRLVFHTENES